MPTERADLGSPVEWTGAAGGTGPAGSQVVSAAFLAMSEGIVVQGVNGEFLSCNPAAERILGLSRDQLAGRTPIDPRWRAVHEDGSPLPVESFPARETLRTGKPLRDVVIGVHAPDRALSWISVNSEPIPGDDGRPAAVVATFDDVTRRRRTEETLKRQGELFSLFVRRSPIYTFVKEVTPAGSRVVQASDCFREMIGLPGSEIVGTFMDELFPPEFAAKITADDRAVVTGGEPRTMLEELGDRTYTTTKYPLVVGTDGVLAGYTIDVTDRLRIEKALQESEADFRLMVEGVEDYAIVMLDPDGHVVRWNAGAERIQGYRTDEIVGRHFSRFFLREEIEQGEPGRELAVAEREGRMEVQGWRVRKDGSQFVAQVTITAQRDGAGRLRGFGKITRDVTERQLNEDRILAQSEDLALANRELDAFAASVSHDLRAPLRAIEGFTARIVKGSGERLDPEGKRLFAVVRESAVRMSRLVDDLLSFSRASRTKLHLSRLAMEEIARSALAEVAGGPEARPAVTFRVGGLPDVEGDPSLVRQVWINLLSNAVKYSARQERPEVELSGRIEGDFAVYQVRDNGAGFDMAYADKLFGIFQRLHGVSEFEGTGIGLALVKSIVSRHGGRVWADGAVGKGATFSFSLPARPRSDASRSWPKLVLPPGAKPF